MTPFATRTTTTLTLCLVIGLGSALYQPAQAQDKPAAAAAPAAAKGADPEALAALDKMGVALRALNTFTLNSKVTNEVVLGSGQKLQYGGEVSYAARRPDRLKISMTSDQQSRDIYYDGKSVTLSAPKLGYYTSVPAPATIGEMLKVAKDKYDFEIPLADLFLWGTDPSLSARVQSGFDAGPATVNGIASEHYAFRQDAVDWQVWLANDSSLPIKLIITTTDDPSQPQYTAYLDWKSGAAPVDADFVFTPDANSHRITAADLSAQK